MNDIMCESCKHWRQGDQSAKKIFNVGNCVWMMEREEGDYESSPHVPFWAKPIAYQTISWEGKSCNQWEDKS